MAAKNKNDRLFTTAIVVIGVVGLVYFGWKAVSETTNKSQENPFEYDIEIFKKDGTEYLAYEEVTSFVLNKIVAPHAITCSSSDVLYVGGENTVSVFDLSGKLLDIWSINGQAYSMAIDESDQLYIGTGSEVEVLDSNGSKRAAWTSFGENAILTSIAVSEKDVYVADAGQLVVWRLDKSGNILGRIGEKNVEKEIDGFIIPSAYFDVAIDPDGYLWAVNTGRHQFENYYSNGDLRSTWDRTSMQIDGFSGCCNPSHIAILPSGSFVTAEKGIPRIKIHNQLGDFTSLVASADQFDKGTVGLDLAVDSSDRIVVLDPKRKQIRIFKKREDA